MGRLKISDEQRAESLARYKATVKNITVDADLVKALNELATGLAVNFGFRPTLSQTLRHIVKEARRSWK